MSVTAPAIPIPATSARSGGQLAGVAAPALLPHGTRPQRVIESLLRRRELLRQGRRPDDGRRIALVIEGGGMRGVCSAGGLLAISRLGLDHAFDHVYATSAGVLNAGYFLSGQGEVGITIYYDDLANRRFINPLRFWKMLDVDYLFDGVIARHKPLDTDRIRRSATRFFVSVIEKRTGEAVLVDASRTGASMIDLLRAATAVPVLYNRTVELDARGCIDGGLAVPFPLEQAIAGGCTDIVVLLTRPAGCHAIPANWLHRRVFDLICARGNRPLSRLFADGHTHYRGTYDLAIGRAAAPEGVNIAAFDPCEPETVHRTTIDAAALHAAATAYGRRVLNAFGEDSGEWTPPPLSRAG